jgi:ribosomal protein S18 acetylase RimI-like enzyme
MSGSSDASGDGPFAVEPLGAGHDRSGFRCGVEALNRYFCEQVGQDLRRRVTACFVAREISSGRIAGYYTLAAGGVPVGELPEGLAKRLPRYPTVPVARLGRLAVALDFQGRRLGGALLWDAVERAGRSEVAVYALVVDAKDEAAIEFYRHHGFIAFEHRPKTLVFPLPKKK